MAFDEGLAQRVREILGENKGFEEKKMFGGICFLLRGNMACGVLKEDLIVRVGPENYEESLTRPHSREFDFTGKAMRGWVAISPEGHDSDINLNEWAQKGARYALSLPPK